MKGKRNESIDILKGAAIFLVVLGHTIQTNIEQFDNNFVFRLIYSFHMPFFFFLSGCVFAITSSKMDKRSFIANKALRLLVPFIIWYFPVNYAINSSNWSIPLHTYLTRIIFAPDYGLWFLLVLFLIFFLYFLIHQLNIKLLKGNKYSELYLQILLIYVLQYVPGSFLGMHLLKWHIIFFTIGYYVMRHQDILLRHKKTIFLISLLFIPLVMFWHRTRQPDFIPYVLPYLRGKTLAAIEIYKYAVPLLGMTLYSCAIIYMSQSALLNSFFRLLSAETLGIYAIHFNFFRFLSKTSLFPLLFAYALVVICATLITIRFILRSNKLTRIALLGESK